jgi:Mn-dependent DtxR family transcriptional regulator
MKIKASAEDYLEAIWVLTERHGKVRSTDLAAHMGFSKPTISIIVRKFRDNGYLTFDDDRNIHLTRKGAEIARRIHERHSLLTKVLVAVGVTEKQAYEDACKIEHAISDETYGYIKSYYEKRIAEQCAI